MEAILCWTEAHPGLAAWVQAVGAIAAIMVAFAVVIVQRCLDRSAAAAEAKRNQAKAEDLALLIVRSAVEASREFEAIYETNFMSREIQENVIEALRDRRTRFDVISYSDLGKDHGLIVEEARQRLTKLISICRKHAAVRLPDDHVLLALGEVRQVTRELRDRETALNKSKHS